MSQNNASQARISPTEDGSRADVRCCCGSLLAKLVEGGVELKCRRCKRIMVIPLEADDGEPQVSIGPS